jgi:redox-sensitive bicupin YhaK (pirin superfamily)
MSTPKAIAQILPPPATHMVGDGFKVQNFFPSGYRITKEISPFYLMDYNAPWELPPSDKQRGVGVHPHRGFETVTIAFQGSVAHHDSYGNSGIIGPGDVQWMTAGSGVLHKEYHETEFTKKGGVFQMVQLWVNLPAKHKMTTPKYQGISFEQQGKLTLPNNAGKANVIAGELNGVKGPADTFTPINMFTMTLNANTEFSFDIPEHHNTGILVLSGNCMINEVSARGNDFVLFKHDGKTIHVNSKEATQLLVLSGEPIDEPIAQYGPFLMNTQAELQQAMEDFNNGKFGQLAD